MQIVTQSAHVSYSLIPPYPLLAPPPVYPALPPPKLTTPTIIVEKYTPLDAFIEKVGPLRSIEDMNAEVDELLQYMDERTRRVWQRIVSREVCYD